MSLSLQKLTIVVTILSFTTFCTLGQSVPSSNGNATTISKQQRLDLSICAKGDNLSSIYCNCSEKVASCDFSSFPASPPSKTELRLFVDEIEHPVKRLCICGSPSNVRLNLTRTEHTSNSKLGLIHRVDIFNMTGPLLITDAFKTPFGGDFYMTNVTFLHSLRTLEFDRGDDMLIEDVQDLKCCSQIKVAQHFLKPTLFMDCVEIGTIHSRGIASFHIWKTVILKHLIVSEIKTRGIALDSTERVNVSITNCHFRKVHDEGIELTDFKNVFMAKNVFYEESNDTALSLRSRVVNSSLVIVDNEFNNGLVWSMNAQQVLVWFNMFDFWDNWTFYQWTENGSGTTLPGQLFSIEYNTVGHFLMNDSDLFSANYSFKDKIFFNENVFGSCNCSSIYGVVVPKVFSANPSRCDSLQAPPSFPNSTFPNPRESCLIDFKAVMSKCITNLTALTLPKLCKTHGVSKFSFNAKTKKNTAFKAIGSNNKIVSPFIADMVKELQFNFHIHQVFAHSEEDEDKQYIKSGESGGQSSSHSSGWIVLLVVGSLVFLGCGAYVLMKRKRVGSLITGDSRADSYNVLTTST